MGYDRVTAKERSHQHNGDRHAGTYYETARIDTVYHGDPETRQRLYQYRYKTDRLEEDSIRARHEAADRERQNRRRQDDLRQAQLAHEHREAMERRRAMQLEQQRRMEMHRQRQEQIAFVNRQNQMQAQRVGQFIQRTRNEVLGFERNMMRRQGRR